MDLTMIFTPTVTVGLVAMAVVIVVVGMMLRGKRTPAPVSVVNTGLLAMGFVVFLAYANGTAAQADYNACVARVLRSQGSREYNETLIEVIARETGRVDLEAELTASLDENLPKLELAECEQFQP